LNPALKDRALRALARREHSRAELARKLAPHGTAEEIDTLLTELQQSNLLSDARFAESLVRSRGARFGPAKLRHTLRARGVADELIATALASDDAGELAHAREVWRRKFAAPPVDRHDFARQARFLQGRGFSSETIRRLLKELAE